MERKFVDLKCIRPDTKIVILGTFPSEASRNTFFYHKRTNQFWMMMSAIFHDKSIEHLKSKKFSSDENKHLIENRKNFLNKHKIGLWDMIKSCYIDKSKDSSIKEPEYNDLTILKTECPQLECIYFSSKKAFKHYQKYLKQIDKYLNLKNEVYRDWLKMKVSEMVLPSSSSAYARIRLEDKIKKWEDFLTKYVKK